MNINIDIDYFPTRRLRSLGIVDYSHYDSKIVVNPAIFIKIPGFQNSIKLRFKPEEINLFNSNNLGLTSASNMEELANLPDGIYQVSYTGVIDSKEFKKEINFLRVDKLQNKLKESILKLNITDCNTEKSNILKLQETQFMIYSAIANAEDCNLEKAISLYKLADETLDKFLQDC